MVTPDSLKDKKDGNVAKDLFTAVDFDTFILNLKRFIAQSHTSDLKTKDFLKTFAQFRVSLSFGQGTPALVTWINFQNIDEGMITLSPKFVSLYYDKQGKLFLVLGILEDSKMKDNEWPVAIQEKYPRFIDGDLSEPIKKRYPRSRVFSHYSVDVGHIEESIDSQKDQIFKDLSEAMQIFLDLPQNNPNPQPDGPKPKDITQIKATITGNETPHTTDDESDPIIALLKRKGQVILYGPPGTGKTYHVQNLIKAKTNETYTIEETDYSETKIYVLTTCIGRDLDTSEIALNKEYDYTWGQKKNFQKAFEYLKEGDVLVCYDSKGHSFIGIATCTGKTESTLSYQFIQNLSGPSFQEMKTDPIISQSKFFRISFSLSLDEMEKGDFERILHLNTLTPEDIGLSSNKIQTQVDPTEFITFHQSFSYEEFIEGLRPIADEEGKIRYSVREGIFKQFCRTAYNSVLSKAGVELRWEEDLDVPTLSVEEKSRAREMVQKVPCFLVIDEINRGDISRIFGELITLLEYDKRLLAPHEITTRLPSSRTRFGIPPNLYLVGTMNTADKSIALIDVALRRRFGFIEMMPDYVLLKEHLVTDNAAVQEIYSIAIDLLHAINDRILQEYDRDHQIGHSFLMKLVEERSREAATHELALIWYHEMLPLLQEYFYDSPKRLFKVLGPEFMVKDVRGVVFTAEKQGEAFIQACEKIIHGLE